MNLKDVLTFWFPQDKSLEELFGFWFTPTAEDDTRLRKKFAKLYAQVSQEDIDCNKLTPEEILAVIIVLDQFSRQLNRGQASAFENDRKSLDLCLKGLHRAIDLKLSPLQRLFFYLPLEHAEDSDMQQLSIELYKRLYLQEQDSELKVFLKSGYDYAVIHQEIIKEFMRFPHRNKALNRSSTQEELDYLAASQNSFGQ